MVVAVYRGRLLSNARFHHVACEAVHVRCIPVIGLPAVLPVDFPAWRRAKDGGHAANGSE